jgi:tripartite-type tricarboxylate transporter receptor subunit TctC
VLLSHIKAGKLKALAVTSAKRAPSLPDVPTTGEAGYPKVISDNWYGLVGPAGLPQPVLKRLHAAAISALNSAELIDQYSRVSGVPMPSSPEEYGVFITYEQAKWGKVVKAIGFKAE